MHILKSPFHDSAVWVTQIHSQFRPLVFSVHIAPILPTSSRPSSPLSVHHRLPRLPKGFMGTAKETALATIAQLSSSVDIAHRITAARTIKNAVVGNPTNKRLFVQLGVVEPLSLAASDVCQNPQLAEQAVAALGSLASMLSSDQVFAVVPVLLTALFSANVRTVNAAARALKMFVCSHNADIVSLAPITSTPQVAERLVMLLSGSDEGIAEVCAVILSSSVHHEHQAKVYQQAGAIPALVMLLCRTNHERCVEACLNAMAALARQDRYIAQTLASPHNINFLVLPFTRSLLHALRLSACRLLTIFRSAAQLPSGLDAIVTTALVGLLDTGDIRSQTLTALTLAELVHGAEEMQKVATQENAIESLTELVKSSVDSPDDMDTDTPTSANPEESDLETSRNMEQPGEKTSLRAAATTAMAALCSECDDAREKFISVQVLPYIVDGLSDRDCDVVMASVKCIRSLTRSVKIVRRDITREGVCRALLNLLSSENNDVRRVSSATLCNLVLDFSPVRSVALEECGTIKLVNLLSSEDEELRKNALWAIKNLMFKADSKTKRTVMEKLGYDNLLALCADEHPRVRELALSVVRNLACSGSSETQSKQLDTLFAATGDRLISVLSRALRMNSDNSEIAVQALYVVCNIASGTEEHKACLMESEIPQLLLRWTSHADERARIAAVWCATNLSSKERTTEPRRQSFSRRPQRGYRGAQNHIDSLRRQHLSLPSSPTNRRGVMDRGDSSDRESLMSPVEERNRTHLRSNSGFSTFHIRQPGNGNNLEARNARASMSEQVESDSAPKNSGYEWRIGRLRALGFEGRLRSLVNDPHIEVQGRARAALEMFDCNDVDPLDYDPSTLLDYSSSLLTRQSPRSAPVRLRVAENDSSSAGSST